MLNKKLIGFLSAAAIAVAVPLTTSAKPAVKGLMHPDKSAALTTSTPSHTAPVKKAVVKTTKALPVKKTFSKKTSVKRPVRHHLSRHLRSSTRQHVTHAKFAVKSHTLRHTPSRKLHSTVKPKTAATRH